MNCEKLVSDYGCYEFARLPNNRGTSILYPSILIINPSCKNMVLYGIDSV